jgi:hypothetical protein
MTYCKLCARPGITSETKESKMRNERSFRDAQRKFKEKDIEVLRARFPGIKLNVRYSFILSINSETFCKFGST